MRDRAPSSFPAVWPRTLRRPRLATQPRLLLALIVLVTTGVEAQQPAHTHWEPYKTRAAKPQPDRQLTDPALIGAIDLHAHHDPIVTRAAGTPSRS